MQFENNLVSMELTMSKIQVSKTNTGYSLSNWKLNILSVLNSYENCIKKKRNREYFGGTFH